jgi:DivIVA domain-containing protein
MAEFDTQEYRAARSNRDSASDQIRDRTFPIVMRGYDRAAVDAFLEEVLEIVAELEAKQSDESVVQRKLEEVGEETASILQRAHETADEIAARSRAQADGRLQRAEREADLIRQQADAYSEQIVLDTRLLWDERQRLIEDLRQLADDTLATADDAAERIALPEMIAEPDTESTDPPTGEVEFDVIPGGASEDTLSEDTLSENGAPEPGEESR